MSENGVVVDLADGKIPEGELGSAEDLHNPLGRLFLSFEDGKWLDPPELNPQDFDSMLRRDGKASAVEQALTLPLRWAELSVEPQEGDSGEAELVREALARPANAGGMTTPWDLVVGQMTSAVYMRRAFFEKVFGVRDGRVVYRKLAFRPARSCRVLRNKTDRSFEGFRQQVRTAEGDVRDVDIPAAKAFVYLHGTHRDPLRGSSAMEAVWSAYELKQKVKFLWFQFLERGVTETAVLKTKEADRAKRVRDVAKLKGGGVVGIDEDESLSPFGGRDSAAEIYKDALDWLSAEQSVSVLASFTDLAQQGSGKGSFALSKDQSDLFLQSRQAVLKEMSAQLTAWVGADLVFWNFGADGKAPALKLNLSRDSEQAVKEVWEKVATGPPSAQIPGEFIDLLTEKVAAIVGVDVDKVRTAIEARQRQGENPVAAGANAAVTLLQEAGLDPAQQAAAVPAEG